MNVNYLCLIIVLLFLFIIIFKCYVKIRFKFWSYQPVFHYHNLFYWIYPKGIIDTALPEPNKYCNFINISTHEAAAHDAEALGKIVEFIKTNYYTQKSATYAPSIAYFTAYFSGTNNGSHISIYHKADTILQDATFISEKQIVAIMTTRSVNITIKNLETFPAQYVDCLCVHAHHRKQDIATEIIQTHIYNVYHKNQRKKVSVSLFKREGRLTGIVPLTAYITYQFDISSIPKISAALLHASMQVIEINKQNIRLLTSFIETQNAKFDCFVLPDFSNLLSLISNKVYIIYGIIENHELIAAYFFKDSQMCYSEEGDDDLENREKDKSIKSIDYFGSIDNSDGNSNSKNKKDNTIFLIGFNIALHKAIKKQKQIKLITIENISDNYIIINNLFLLNVIPKFTSPTAYFYYNYAKRPIRPEHALIL